MYVKPGQGQCRDAETSKPGCIIHDRAAGIDIGSRFHVSTATELV
jgi:hypothetical protein